MTSAKVCKVGVEQRSCLTLSSPVKINVTFIGITYYHDVFNSLRHSLIRVVKINVIFIGIPGGHDVCDSMRHSSRVVGFWIIGQVKK